MKCPKCGSVNVRVLDSRMRQSGEKHRRRMCEECGTRFTTVEIYKEKNDYNYKRGWEDAINHVLRIIGNTTEGNDE